MANARIGARTGAGGARTGAERRAPAATVEMFDELDEGAPVEVAQGKMAKGEWEAPREPEATTCAHGVVFGGMCSACSGIAGFGVYGVDPLAPPSLAVREVCSFPAALFPELGPTTLHLLLVAPDGSADAFIVTSSREAYKAAREASVPVFVMRELVALAHAAQNDRMPPHELLHVILHKRGAPEWILSPQAAFGGMPLANAEPLSCTLGEAFDKMGARLASVEVHGT